jgi:hypothetical protein
MNVPQLQRSAAELSPASITAKGRNKEQSMVQARDAV